jgi:DNA-binding response OmpR family regulator
MSTHQLGNIEPSKFSGARILLVDDERGVRRSLARLFKRIGYEVTQAAGGAKALDLIARHTFDLVILDLKMPGMEGTEVLKQARPLAPDTMFIIMTAYGTLDSAITAMRHGALDYLLKPSPVKEIVRAVEAGLSARQEKLQRQDPITLLEQALDNLKTQDRPPTASSPASRFLQISDVTIDQAKQLVVVQGQPIDLTPTEFEILTYLMCHRDRVVSGRELVAELRGFDLKESDARTFLRAHIHRLRHKIEPDPSQPRYICTVRGSGYMFATHPLPPSTS